jgi:hypothetical protein
MNSSKLIVLKSLPVYLCVLILIGLVSCNKDCNDPGNPDCPNYDPCCSLSPVNAGFTISELQVMNHDSVAFYGLDTLLIETDTVLDPSYVIFEAKYKGATTYKWQIGTEANPRFGKKIAVLFNSLINPVSNLTIDIKLIVEDTPNLTCFPNDNGIDSLIKPLTIVPKSQAVIFGNWEGSSTEFPNETYTITLDTFTTNPQGDLYFFQNFPNGCDNGAKLWLMHSGAMWSDTGSDYCEYAPNYTHILYCRAYLLDNGNIKIDYLSYCNPSGGAGTGFLKQFSFTGKQK